MRKIAWNVFIIGLVLAAALFAACNNPVAKQVNSESLPEGFGSVNISLGAEGTRTIFPTKAFDDYSYSFNRDGGAPEEKEPENGVFVLEAGSWTVYVEAYNTGILAATGTGSFTIEAGESKRVDITINPESGTDPGTFKYNIKYPSGTNVQSFTLVKLPDNTPLPGWTYSEGSIGMNGTVSDVPPGFYLLNLSLSKGGLSSGTTEVVCISSGLTTEYGTERAPVIFGSSYFTPQEEGIYVGLVTFAGSIENSTYQTPLLLNATGKTNLVNDINSSYNPATQAGTALYYGIHKGLENLKSNEAAYPSNLMSVNLITFTDGLEQGSAAQSLELPIEGKSFTTGSEYSSYIKSEIQDRTIAGKPITAYSVGVRGGDVTNIPGFQTAIKDIASPDKDYELTSFGEVQAVFDNIANSLVIEGESKTSFNLITPMFDSGTTVRMTFDSYNHESIPAPAFADASTRYIEGTIEVVGTGSSRYRLTNIHSAGGINSGVEGGSLTGTIDGTELLFAFDDITGYKREYQADALQWRKYPGDTAWQINSEYNSSGSTTTKIEKHSTVIYLVMDASSSLSDDQIDTIRDAATSFINSLYNRYYMLQSSTYLTSGVWANGTIEDSDDIHQYTFNVTAGTRYNVWLNERYDGDGSRTLDASVNAQYSDGSSIFPYYSEPSWTTPQSFTPSVSGTVTLRVQPSYYNTGTYAVVYNTGTSAVRPAYTPPESIVNPQVTWPIDGNVWVNGNIRSGKTDRYSFDVEAGKTYYVWWNDSYDGDSSKTANVSVSAQYGNGTVIFSDSNSYGWSTPQTIIPTASGKVYIEVSLYYGGGTGGTYAIGYTTNSPPLKPETVITPLVNDDWKDGELLSSGEVDVYSFDVEVGKTYYVWWNDSYNGDSSKTANVSVSARYGNGTVIFSDSNSYGWSTPQTIIPTASGKVYIEVSLYYGGTGTGGTYAIGYTTNSPPLKPETVITPLVNDDWKDGELLSSGEVDVYSFDVEVGKTYYVWWNGSGDGDSSKTANVSVSAQYGNGTVIFSGYYYGWSMPRTITPTASGKVYVRVAPLGGSPGTYAVVYNETGTRPSVE